MSDTYGIGDFYKSFKKINKTSFNKITPQKYSNIIDRYHEMVIDSIIFDNYKYKFKTFGEIYIAMRKGEVSFADDKINVRMGLDRIKSREFNKKIYFENEHTNGFVFAIKFKKPFNSIGKTFYFKPNRYKFKRYLASILKDKNNNINAEEYV